MGTKSSVKPPASVGSHADDWQADRALYRLGLGLSRLTWLMEENGDGTVRVTRMTVYDRREKQGDILVVVKGLDDAGAAVVCFESGLDAAETVRLALEKAVNRAARWKADKPYEERTEKAE